MTVAFIEVHHASDPLPPHPFWRAQGISSTSPSLQPATQLIFQRPLNQFAARMLTFRVSC